MTPDSYGTLADLVLITHVSFVIFVVLGLFVILVGGFCNWNWVRNPWFRVLHLVAIGFVVLQSWLGIICPLTTIEIYLRESAGDVTYEGSFIAHWLEKFLYYDAPDWVFILGYSLFGGAVLASRFFFRPRSRH